MRGLLQSPATKRPLKHLLLSIGYRLFFIDAMCSFPPNSQSKIVNNRQQIGLAGRRIHFDGAVGFWRGCLSSQNENVRFHQHRNVRFCTVLRDEGQGKAKYSVPFIERPVFAPLRQSQAFSQTLVLGLAESLTLSSLRSESAATMKGTFLFW